jgi:hypothetical protein
MIDELFAVGFKIARQVVVFQQDAVLERLMPAFDLALKPAKPRHSRALSECLLSPAPAGRSEMTQSHQRANEWAKSAVIDPSAPLVEPTRVGSATLKGFQKRD